MSARWWVTAVWAGFCCQTIADDIEQARAKAGRERQEEPLRGRITFKGVSVPEECAGELEEHGLKTR